MNTAAIWRGEPAQVVRGKETLKKLVVVLQWSKAVITSRLSLFPFFKDAAEK